MTQKEILEDIQSFIDPKIREDNPELALGEQDLTVLRQKVTPGITFEEVS